MSDTDLTAICARLTLTLHEIEDRMSAPVDWFDAPDTPPVDAEFASLSQATIAANRLRYAAHFKTMNFAGATAGL
jgi:hypothetical protein